MLNLSSLAVLLTLGSFILGSRATAVTLSGGQLTINGSVTTTYFDFMIDFKANVQWVAMIWSQNEADTDVTLFQINANSPSKVTLTDCYLDQNSFIQVDNVQNFMPSGTGLTGDISTGIKRTFKRELVTGDTKDITLYANSVIQVCFICANQPFVGGGYETGHQKACSYLSLHVNAKADADRMLGNFAGTATFGGGNLTVYASQSTDGNTIELWQFVSIVHKAQGLSSFTPRWIAMQYSTSLVNSDLAVVQYTTVGVSLDIQIGDYYSVNTSFADKDNNFVLSQGSQDLVTVLTAYDASSYYVGTFKRKFETGDVNRDQIVTEGANTYCFIYGNALAFTTSFTQDQVVCFNFTLTTQYNTNFRQTSSTSVTVQSYQAPPNTVLVVTAADLYIMVLVVAYLCLAF